MRAKIDRERLIECLSNAYTINSELACMEVDALEERMLTAYFELRRRAAEATAAADAIHAVSLMK